MSLKYPDAFLYERPSRRRRIKRKYATRQEAHDAANRLAEMGEDVVVVYDATLYGHDGGFRLRGKPTPPAERKRINRALGRPLDTPVRG